MNHLNVRLDGDFNFDEILYLSQVIARIMFRFSNL